MSAMDYSQIAHWYDTYVKTDLDVSFFLNEAKDCDRVLELTSGTGRLSMPLIEAGISLTYVLMLRTLSICLNNGQFFNCDWERSLAIIEELEEMGGQDKINNLQSFLVILLVYLIKIQVEKRVTRSWRNSISLQKLIER